MMDFTVKFIDAMGMGRKIPLAVWGYSLGAGTAVSLLAHYPERIWKLVAVAPAFYETLDDQFADQIRQDPRKVHAWETVPDCQHFFTIVSVFIKKILLLSLNGFYGEVWFHNVWLRTRRVTLADSPNNW
mmetsp:Transcript_41604/g.49865  ORF Transcript_41604/g.49865 Transcript_41604/m.49865 type:complete len:129 (+) Transcript_41604:522-908(+)